MRWVSPIWAPNPSCVASRCPERIGLATAQRSGSAESFGRFLKQIFDGLESRRVERRGSTFVHDKLSLDGGRGIRRPAQFEVGRECKVACNAHGLE